MDQGPASNKAFKDFLESLPGSTSSGHAGSVSMENNVSMMSDSNSDDSFKDYLNALPQSNDFAQRSRTESMQNNISRESSAEDLWQSLLPRSTEIGDSFMDYLQTSGDEDYLQSQNHLPAAR